MVESIKRVLTIISVLDTLIYFVVMLLVVSCGQPTSDANLTVKKHKLSVSNADHVEGWELLFDGENTDQWRAYNREDFPSNGWVVEDRQLVFRSRESEAPDWGGTIITKQQYKDFELTLEVMLTDLANSGIFYRAIEKPEHEIWNFAPEYQILAPVTETDVSTDKNRSVFQMGDCNGLYEGEKDYSAPLGEWNTIRILCIGSHIEHWLNGKLVISYDINSENWIRKVKTSKFSKYPQFGQSLKGHIGLEEQNYGVRFRNIKIRKINE